MSPLCHDSLTCHARASPVCRSCNLFCRRRCGDLAATILGSVAEMRRDVTDMTANHCVCVCVCVCHCQRHDDKRSDYANAAAESPPPDRAVVAYLAGRKLTATAKRRQDKTVGRFASELDRVSLLGRLLSPCKLLPLSAKSHLRTYNQMYRTHLSVLKTSHNGVDNSLSQSVSLSLSLSLCRCICVTAQE